LIVRQATIDRLGSVIVFDLDSMSMESKPTRKQNPSITWSPARYQLLICRRSVKSCNQTLSNQLIESGDTVLCESTFNPAIATTNSKLIRNRKLQKKYLKLSQTQLIEHLLIIYVCFFYPDFEPDSRFFRLYESGLRGRVYKSFKIYTRF
jgi:hypothetical protein